MPGWFKKSGKRREEIVYGQKKQIAGIYRSMFFSVRDVIGYASPRKGFVIPNVIRKIYFESMERSIGDVVNRYVSQIEPLIEQNMRESSSAVMDDAEEFLEETGFGDDVIEMFEEQKEERVKKIVSMVVSGQLYDKKWSLSGFTMDEKRAIMEDVHKIISRCIEKDMSAAEMASYLEMYFNPDQQKKAKFFVLFPGVKRKIDYNTKRTGNTMVGHAYEETFVNTTMQNPFIEAYRWITSGSDRVCPVCIDRESTDKFGLGVGIFPKDQLPLDHPNGMCTFDPVYVMEDGEIVREVELWRSGSGSMKDKIDKWVESFKK